MVVVEAIAYDKLIADRHCYIVDLVLIEELLWLEEECTNRYTRWLTCVEIVEEVVHAVACLDDILDDDDILTFDVEVDAELLLDSTCRLYTLI